MEFEMREVSVDDRGNMQAWFVEQIHDAMRAIVEIQEAFDALKRTDRDDKYRVCGCETFAYEYFEVLCMRLGKLDWMLHNYPENCYGFDLIALDRLVKSGFDYSTLIRPKNPLERTCPADNMTLCSKPDCGGCVKFLSQFDSMWNKVEKAIEGDSDPEQPPI